MGKNTFFKNMKKAMRGRPRKESKNRIANLTRWKEGEEEKRRIEREREEDEEEGQSQSSEGKDDDELALGRWRERARGTEIRYVYDDDDDDDDQEDHHGGEDKSVRSEQRRLSIVDVGGEESDVHQDGEGDKVDDDGGVDDDGEVDVHPTPGVEHHHHRVREEGRETDEYHTGREDDTGREEDDPPDHERKSGRVRKPNLKYTRDSWISEQPRIFRRKKSTSL